MREEQPKPQPRLPIRSLSVTTITLPIAYGNTEVREVLYVIDSNGRVWRKDNATPWREMTSGLV